MREITISTDVNHENKGGEHSLLHNYTYQPNIAKEGAIVQIFDMGKIGDFVLSRWGGGFEITNFNAAVSLCHKFLFYLEIELQPVNCRLKL